MSGKRLWTIGWRSALLIGAVLGAGNLGVDLLQFCHTHPRCDASVRRLLGESPQPPLTPDLRLARIQVASAALRIVEDVRYRQGLPEMNDAATILRQWNGTYLDWRTEEALEAMSRDLLEDRDDPGTRKVAQTVLLGIGAWYDAHRPR